MLPGDDRPEDHTRAAHAPRVTTPAPPLRTPDLPDTDAMAEILPMQALDMAACIGCGACVAACPNGSAHLFVGSKLAHLSLLPTGRLERGRRARAMLGEMEQDFGPCSLYGECAQVCPADIPLTAIAAVNKEGLRSFLRHKDD